MDELYQIQSLLIGLIGWAGTILAILYAPNVTMNDRRIMVVCSWLLWLIPALGTFVYRGIMTTSTVAIICAFSTLFVGAIVAMTMLPSRTKHKDR